jgi:hypothetical protein
VEMEKESDLLNLIRAGEYSGLIGKSAQKAKTNENQSLGSF